MKKIQNRSQKRSKIIQLFLISSSIMTLTACEEKPKEKSLAFKDEQECRKTHSEEECKKALIESKAKYAETAPKFTSKEECEKQYGPGKCAEGQHAGGHGGGFFMPMMMGFMMGRMLGGASQPVLPPAAGPSAGRGGWSNPATNTNRTVSRGGFGNSGSTFSSGG